MKYFQYLVIAALLLLLAACGRTQAPEVAPTEETLQTTAAYANIVGTVYETNTTRRVAGADVYLYRSNGSQWISLGKKAMTDASGNYTIRNAATGYYYHVGIGKVYGACYTGSGVAVYHGYSVAFQLSSLTRANARIYYSHWINC